MCDDFGAQRFLRDLLNTVAPALRLHGTVLPLAKRLRGRLKQKRTKIAKGKRRTALCALGDLLFKLLAERSKDVRGQATREEMPAMGSKRNMACPRTFAVIIRVAGRVGWVAMGDNDDHSLSSPRKQHSVGVFEICLPF